MHVNIVRNFARKSKTLISQKIPENLRQISIFQNETRQITPTVNTSGKYEIEIPKKAVEIIPKEDQPKLHLKINHPQKYLTKTNLFSIKEVKNLLENDSIIVNNSSKNLPTQELPFSEIKLRNDFETKEILVSNKKVYLFYKPKGLICLEKDKTTKNRKTIFWYLENYHNLKGKWFLCVS